jgi:muramoyltetrapeptide carboxypeptidase
MEAQPAGSISAGYAGKTVSILRGGMAEGRLVGGNLSVLCASLGTPFQPVFKGKILFFEDVGEKPYRLDRLLTQLLNAGIFSQVAGVAVGVNQDCGDPAAKPGGEYRQSAADVVKERLAQLRVPVVTGLPFGHVDLNATIPVGAMAELDGKRGDLIITESAVS